MTPPRHVVYDSDDSGDALSPLPSPPRPPPVQAESSTGGSTSTDPSFFRDIYEEQRKSAAARDDTVWDVPISPEPVGRHGTKRKRAEGGTSGTERLHVILSQDETQKRQRQDEEHEAAHKKPRTGDDVELVHLPSTDGPQPRDGGVGPPPSAATESTIAYPTPSRWATVGWQGDDGGPAADGRVGQSTPTRRAPPTDHLLSSPDEIAGPAVSRSPLARLPSLRESRGAAKPDSGTDALSTLTDLPNGDDDDGWAASFDSPRPEKMAEPREPKSPKANTTQEKDPEVVYIDATDDDNDGDRFSPVEHEPAKKEKKKKRGRPAKAKPKPKEAAPAEGRTAKKKRGRPKHQPEAVELPESPRPADAPSALGETSGNALLLSADEAEARLAAKESPVPAPVPAVPARSPEKTDRAGHAEKAAEPVGRAVPQSKPDTGRISTSTPIPASQGRVPFRVGLSKRFRIAPLLKSLPK